jgi:hypothetical protein
MLLPVVKSLEDEFVTFCGIYLDDIGVPEEDRAAWLAVELRSWRSTGDPSDEFAELIEQTLYDEDRKPSSFMLDLDNLGDVAFRSIASEAAGSYFVLHQALLDSHLLDHDEARQLLSHAGLIARLAQQERMTASEISRLISSRDARFRNNWRVISAILTKFRCQPKISDDIFRGTFDEDGVSEAFLYGDAPIVDSIDLVAGLAGDLGCPGDFKEWLRDLLLRDYHAPYLLILHFQLISLEHYDHAPTYAYEFSPRGQNAIWLTEQYASFGIPVAQSAFLNNAKATLRFDGSWVAGRSDHFRSASALATILQQIESLGYLAKLEIASHIRSLLRRFIRVEREKHGALPRRLGKISDNRLSSLIEAVAAENSGTAGIAEQRLIDCVASIECPASDGWHSKGVGDSVFAANLPRRKIGDCEFTKVEGGQLTMSAYEAHGGHLSAPYVTDHLSTLEKVILLRHEELAIYGDPAEWYLSVTFVAHTLGGNLPPTKTVVLPSGTVTVALGYQTFEEKLATLTAWPDRLDIVDEHFRLPLNVPFVHPQIRATITTLLDG